MIYEDGDQNKMQFLFPLVRIVKLSYHQGNKICFELQKYGIEAPITELILNDN